MTEIPPRLVLASRSPRRRRLLRELDIDFEATVSDADESSVKADTPEDFALRAARLKCLDIARRRPAESVVLGADTVVFLPYAETDDRAEGLPGLRMRQGILLGKPGDPAQARAMLRHLAGHTHTVYTAVAAARGGAEVRAEVEASRVRFHPVGETEIARYVETGEPMDKAGAYAVQGIGGRLVADVDGDVTNVIGLPLGLTARLLSTWYPRLSEWTPPERDWLRTGAG